MKSLAMAQYQLQQIDPARGSLAERAGIEQKSPRLDSGDIDDDWNDWIAAHALMSEAKALIGGQPATAK